MNILLIFFAIPIAVIILSIILETFIKCPIKVAGIFFAIFLVIAVALGGSAELLIATIIYTIISFISAWIIRIFCMRENECNRNRRKCCDFSNCMCRNFEDDDYYFNNDVNLDSISENNIIRTNNTMSNDNSFNCCRRRR